MKFRFAWLGDAEFEDSFSAREARILLRAVARNSQIVPLWFAVGSAAPPRIWNGIRILPIPRECLATPEFLDTLVLQQRPDVVFSNLSAASLSGVAQYLSRRVKWIHRVPPEDLQSRQYTHAATVLVGEKSHCAETGRKFLPYIQGLDPAIREGTDATSVLHSFEDFIGDRNGIDNDSVIRLVGDPYLVMRQQLFYNSSLSRVMFELTNALLEIGIPTVPQDEHTVLAGNSFHRDEDALRLGAPEKYERIRNNLQKKFDPEAATTVHFVLLKSAQEYTRCGTYPALAGREILYVTGNHTVTPEKLRELSGVFRMILAPSEHVLRPYVEAGLPRKFGAVVPHGVDPAVYSPEAKPFNYPTQKRFKFLQTSFPWVHDKGFDLTLKAFGKAFTSQDDVALILRVPRIRDSVARERYFGQLEALVKEEQSKPGAPEIVLLELDMELNRMGSIYTGANCYVHPLRAEGFGITILEAMACGLPVIATPWSGPADYLSARWAYTLRHGKPVPEKAADGTVLRYHVEPELEHLIESMRYAFEHEEEGKVLGKRAAVVVRDEWTWKHAARKLASVFMQTSPVNVFGPGNRPVEVYRPPSVTDRPSDATEEDVKKAKVRNRLRELPPGDLKDQNDYRIVRSGRTPHEGQRFVAHKFVQPAPLLFSQDHHPLWLGDIYRGRSAFLIAGGPSFGLLDHSKLRQPGVLTMGMNNSVRTFRPNLWICVDAPDHFVRSVWLDPTIMKFVPVGHANRKIFNSDEWKFMDLNAGDCPNMVYFKRNEHFKANQFLWEDTINWGNHKKLGGGRSVMMAALRILFTLGIRRLYLLGVDFKMDEQTRYHFEQDRNKGSINGNNATYRHLNKRFAKLQPYFKKENFLVYNCNPDSNLKAFPYMPFDTAIQNVLAEFDFVDVSNERTKGLYDTNTKDKELGKGK